MRNCDHNILLLRIGTRNCWAGKRSPNPFQKLPCILETLLIHTTMGLPYGFIIRTLNTLQPPAGACYNPWSTTEEEGSISRDFCPWSGGQPCRTSLPALLAAETHFLGGVCAFRDFKARNNLEVWYLTNMGFTTITLISTSWHFEIHLLQELRSFLFSFILYLQ